MSKVKTPVFPKNRGKEIEQTLTKSAFPILQKFHNAEFHGYPATSGAQEYSALYLEKNPDVSIPALQEIVFRTFVRCGLIVGESDIENTVRGNVVKSHPDSKRFGKYNRPKWSFHKFAIQYLLKVSGVVVSEISAERKEKLEQSKKEKVS